MATISGVVSENSKDQRKFWSGAGHRTTAWIPLAAAIILFLLQALPYLSYRWVTDESWYSAPAYSVSLGHGLRDPAIGANDLESRFDARPPGTAVVISTAFRLFGVSQVSARLGSILAGVAIILLTYRLALTAFGQYGAMIAAFIIATDNFIVLTSRTARPEALTTAMILASLLSIQEYHRRARRHWALLAGLMLAIGTMFHVTLLGFLVSGVLLIVYSDWTRDCRFLRGLPLFIVGYVAGLVPAVLWILSSPLGVPGFKAEYLMRAVGIPFSRRLFEEQFRYADFLGFGVIQSHGLGTVPLRLPLLIILLGASLLLCRFHRNWFYLQVVLLVPTLLWFVYTANKSSRYVAIISPVLALTMAAAASLVREHSRLAKTAAACILLVVGAQVTANCMLLYAASKADYSRVEAELRNAIPPGRAVYGGFTFWLGLRDRQYIAYERTDPVVAAEQFHVQYFILGDRVLTRGVRTDQAYVTELAQHLNELAGTGDLVAHVPSAYYGDLLVYRLRTSDASTAQASPAQAPAFPHSEGAHP